LMRATQDINAKPLSRIAYSQRPDATASGEINALANIYAFILRSQRGGEHVKQTNRAGTNESNPQTTERKTQNKWLS
jgi:hypothetical protein